jgi:hypothetical protein
VPGVDEATVTLLRDDSPITPATTSELVAELDHDQYRMGDGPCLEAAKIGKLVRVSMTDAQRRWPSFAADVRKSGFGSVLSAPLGGQPIPLRRDQLLRPPGARVCGT